MRSEGLKNWSFDGFERAVEEQGLKIDRYYHHDESGTANVLQGYSSPMEYTHQGEQDRQKPNTGKD